MLTIFGGLLMPFAHLKTGRFHYEVFGDKQLPAVLLIMGLGMPAAGWTRSFISMLLEKSLRVITVDNRDAGLSEHFSHLKTSMSVPAAIGRTLLRLPVQAPYLLEDMALDLVQLLDELKLQRAHVVGASMGGMIGQTLASIRPSRVASLTSVMSASGNPRTGLGKLRAIYSILMHSGDLSTEDGREKHLERVFMTLKSPSYEYSAQEKHELLHEMSRYEIDQAAGERQLLAILASGDRSGDIARITAPTLVIHGEDDPLLPLAAGKEVADLIPKSEFISLPRMGHDLPPIHFETITRSIASHVWQAEA